MIKLLVSFGLVALTCAQQKHHQEGQATSYSSFTQHVQPIHHHHSQAQGSSISSGSSSSSSSIHHVPVIHQAPQVHVPVVHSAPVQHIPVHHVPVYHSAAPVVEQQHHYSVASGATGGSQQEGGHHEVHHEIYAIPKYHFKYGVEDHHTGDFHSQEEERDGDKVKGYYALREADGTTRIVHYTADKHSGFNAIVERKGHAQHPQVHHGHHQ